jgi:hypothetical protein
VLSFRQPTKKKPTMNSQKQKIPKAHRKKRAIQIKKKKIARRPVSRRKKKCEEHNVQEEASPKLHRYLNDRKRKKKEKKKKTGTKRKTTHSLCFITVHRMLMPRPKPSELGYGIYHTIRLPPPRPVPPQSPHIIPFIP